MAGRERTRVHRPIENVASGATWDGKGRGYSPRNAIGGKGGKGATGKSVSKER